MQAYNILKLILFVFLMCAGQILFKKTSLIISNKSKNLEGVEGIIEFILSIITTNYFFLALITYGVATFYWLYLLQSIPLSLAYPFTALAMVIIPITSFYLFNEPLNEIFWVGAVLIFMGIIIISLGSK